MQRVEFLSLALVMGVACTARAEEEEAKPEPKYEISVTADPTPVHKDGPATYLLTITPKGEWVMKKETPFKATLGADANIELDKAAFNNKDFKDPDAPAKSITTSFTASAAGAKAIKAVLSFFLCTEKICQRHKDEVELKLEVADAAP